MGLIVFIFFLFAVIMLIAGLSKTNNTGKGYRGRTYSNSIPQNNSTFEDGIMINNPGFLPNITGESSNDNYAGAPCEDMCSDSGCDCSSGDSNYDSGSSDCGCDCSTDSGSSCSCD